ncbi:MAG: polymer-forming cytoskeletal protein [Caldilineaceae bacterium SB0661_bin_32]|uniref:Polymer-forming cytoskeletal protein n=1 Tax=Caldilineaceae bacterium SB0661_bin_32 TaxID=2605255 RepID=A0A6B1DDP1_9CHLR|nr:polymer-forming cytoskeletal protein [Caldilineaceae bacterium SB0661_bin_32]
MQLPKKSARWLVVAFMALLTLAVSSAALAAEFAGDQTYRLAEGETVDDDLYIAATEIFINGTVKGDLLAGASYIEIGPNGVIEGDLWAAANGIVIHGTILDDLRAAGSGIELTGTVADDAFLGAGGGQTTFPTGAGSQAVTGGLNVTGEVGGDFYVGAAEADISGAVGGDLFGALGMLYLSGTVGGDVDIQVGEFTVTDAARIGGELSYAAPEQRQIPAGVARDIQYEAPPASESAGGTIVGAIFGWIFRTIAIGIGVAILGWLLLRLRPNILVRPAAAIQSSPVETGLYGLLAAVVLIFIPIASLILVAFTWAFWGVLPAIATFIFLVASSALVWFLSPLLTGYWLGEKIGERLGGDYSPLLLLLMGALLIVVLGRLPVLGWLVYLLSFILALGGLLRSGAAATGDRPAETAVVQ